MKLRFPMSLLPVFLGSLFFVSALFAQPELMPEVEKGVLAGVIVTDTGEPLWGKIPIYLTYPDEETITITADENGLFSEEAPAGAAVVYIPGDEKPYKVTITAQQRTELKLTIARKGIVVSMIDANGAPAPVDTVTGLTMMGENEPQVFESYQLDDTHWWFPDAGEGDNFALSAGSMLFDGDGTTVEKSEWTFDQPERFRAVSMTVGKRNPVRLAVVDEGGAPLRETELRLNVSFDGYRYMPSPWETALKRRITVHPYGLSTDADGMLELGELPAGKYQLSMRAGTQAGPLVDLELKPDGTQNIRQYALDLPPARTVRQTVFDADGRPAPNAEVSASYAWLGKMTVARAKSDARGVVTWHDIPPAPAIVWGARVPPCLLPHDRMTVDEPLPVPRGEDEEGYQLILTIANPTDPPTPTSIAVLVGNQNGYDEVQWASPVYDNMELEEWNGEEGEGDGENIEWVDGEQVEENEPVNEEGELVDEIAAPVPEPNKYYVSAMPGNPFSLWAATADPLPRVAVLDSLYLPIADSAEPVELPLTLSDGALIHVKLVSRDERPIPRAACLGLMPLTPDQPYDGFGYENYNEMGVQSFDFDHLRPVKGGEFDARVPRAGTYRLLVDLCDETTPPLPGTVLEVKPGEQTFTVTLPEPLISLPAGAEVSWLSKNAPADTQRLTVPAFAPRMPLYGSRDDLLALWYRPAPGTLELHRFPGGAAQTFTLRSTEIDLPADIPLHSEMPLTIEPLLPVSPAEQQAKAAYRESYQSATGFMPRETDLSDRAGTIVRESGQMVDLWSGQYTLSSEIASGWLSVPEQGDSTCTLRQAAENGDDNQWRYLNIEFPQADYDEIGEKASYNIGITTDAPNGNVDLSTYRPMNEDLMRNVMAPSNARRINLHWLGYGVIRNVAIPEADLELEQWEQPAIQLPEWEPGITVSGAILATDGSPAAQAQLQIMINNDYQQMLTVQTDENGHFVVNGLLPGPLSVTYQANDPYRYNPAGCWILEVPEAGLTDVVLRASDYSLHFNREYSDESTEAWWLPDGEKVSQIPGWNNSESGCYNLTRGSGWLWIALNPRGGARCYRVKAEAQVLTERKQARGPALGITLPLTPDAGKPGAVTITGQGERAGVQYCFGEFAWQPSAALGLIVGQIDAVPPGKYLVRIETEQGAIEREVTVTEYGCRLAAEWPAER